MTLSHDPFESPKLLLEEARDNIQNVKAQLDAFFATNPYTYVIDLDPETGEKLYKCRIDKDIPGSVRVKAHSAISHMRHVLDQACYASALILAPGGGRSLTNFVFGDNPANLDVVLAKAAKHIPAEIQDVIRALQPYRRGQGHAGGNDKLWILGKIAGPNKHRTVIDSAPLGLGYDVGKIEITSEDGGFIGPIDFAPVWDPEKREMIHLRAPKKAKAKFDISSRFTIVFRNPAVPEIDGAPAMAVLRDLLGIVEEALTAIEERTLAVQKAREG